MTQLLNAIPGALAQGLIWGVMAIGVYITYKVLDIADLTVDGSLCTGAAVCTMLLLAGHSPWIAMLCAVLAGLLAGTVTGLLHVLLGIPPILAGILTQMVLWSVNLKILGKANQALPARQHRRTAVPDEHPRRAAGAAGLGCGAGDSAGPVLQHRAGLRPPRHRLQPRDEPGPGREHRLDEGHRSGAVQRRGGYVRAGLLCQYQGYTDVNMGRGAVVIGLAAVVIGQAVLGRHGGHMAAQLGGVVLGAVIYYIVYQVIIFAGFDTDLLKMFSAVVVAVFLGVPHVRDQTCTNSVSKRRSRHAENA